VTTASISSRSFDCISGCLTRFVMIHWSAVTVVSTLAVRNSVQRFTISASVSARSPSSLGSRWASSVST